MLTSKVQLGYVLTRGGGQADQGSLSCPPPPRISERIDNPQILLHHLLQEYLVERDINIISINLRSSLQRFSWVMYWQDYGAIRMNWWHCSTQILGGGQDKPAWTACPPPLGHRVTKLMLNVNISDKGNQTDVGCKHLSLTEIMFISLTTKYSKIMVH